MHHSNSGATRLLGLDALRGLAALSVLAFHFTTRYEHLYGHADPLGWGFPPGRLGVHLFFLISGFVIFMTLDRLETPRDFLVSRFSRLFPAFWLAVLLSWGVQWLNALGDGAPPLREPLPVASAAANLLMVHGLFGVASVDGVYWTLQVELSFYLCMFLLWLGGWLQRPLPVLLAWLALALAANLLPQWTGLRLPWVLSELLVLEHLPWFALGLAVYLRHRDDQAGGAGPWLLGALALFTLLRVHGAASVVWGLVFSALLVLGLGAKGSAWLRPWVWLGAVSYPLYLLHQEIGFVLIHGLQRAGMGTITSLGLTTLACLALAAAVHYRLEQPALKGLRRHYRQWSQRRPRPSAPRLHWLGATVLVLAVLAGGSVLAARLKPPAALPPALERTAQQR
jgi:peptidoglycan/LPS O-acetylase OafA/YrhL